MKVLCVNGPAKGKRLDVDIGVSRMFQVADPTEQFSTEGWVTYRVERFAFKSSHATAIIWLAYCGAASPLTSDIAEVLLSQEARECLEFQ